MRPLNIWKKIKKPFGIGLTLIISIAVSFGGLHFSNGKAEPIFSEVLGAFMPLAVFNTGFSVLLFNYIDSISKDISSIDGNHSKIKSALISLSALKKEVVVTASLIVALLILEVTIKGVAESIDSKNIPFESFYWVLISIRFCAFVLAILAVSEQIRGLIVAIEYRNVIHAGKSSKNLEN